MTDIVDTAGAPLILQNPDEDPYKSITIGLTLETEDVLGYRIENEQVAEAFNYLTNKFFTSEFVYEQFKVFTTMHMDKALAEVKSREIIAP